MNTRCFKGAPMVRYLKMAVVGGAVFALVAAAEYYTLLQIAGG